MVWSRKKDSQNKDTQRGTAELNFKQRDRMTQDKTSQVKEIKTRGAGKRTERKDWQIEQVGDFSCTYPYKMGMMLGKDENSSFKQSYFMKFFSGNSDGY